MIRTLNLATIFLLIVCLLSCGGGSSGAPTNSGGNGSGGSGGTGGGGGGGGGTGSSTGTLSQSTLDFNIVTVGNSASQPVVLRNAGDAAMKITSIKVAAPFSETNNCPSSLKSQKACTITVTFKPVQALPFAGSLTISDDATNTPQTASLNGIGGTVPVEATSPHPNIRTRYLRTDLQYAAYPQFPPRLTVYDPVHKRFFMSNPSLNQVDVFDDATESQIGSFAIPSPWGLDVTPDGATLYIGTYYGDVYSADPGAMQVLQRYPSASLGPNGFAAVAAFVLADGSVALLGQEFGLPIYDGQGYGEFAIWNPANNDLQAFSVHKGDFPIGQMTLSADRTKIIVGSVNGRDVFEYDTTTGNSLDRAIGNFSQMFPFGSELFLFSFSDVLVVDVGTLQPVASVNIYGHYPPIESMALGSGGGTFFLVDQLGNVSAWDTTTLKQIGWVPNFQTADLPGSIVPGAVDENNLIVGPTGHGVAFLDGSQIKSGAGQQIFTASFLSPSTGPTSGGTAVQSPIYEENAPGPVTISSGKLFIGNGTAADSFASTKLASGTTPSASFSGAADFTLVTQDGSMTLMPENFSYGPAIVEVSPNAATAEGGGQGIIFGYGLGQTAGDVQVNIGGQFAKVTKLMPTAAQDTSYPFPMEAVFFTVPPGVSGTTVDVTVKTVDGTATASGAFNYVAALQPYPLSGVTLNQGVYDSTRGLLYFAAGGTIQVFSLSSNSWQTPWTLPGTGSHTNLTVLSLSANGNILAVSDPGDTSIYLVSPDSPGTAQSFSLARESPLEPCGIAIANSGMIYYATYNIPGNEGGNVFHSLNTSNGVITDLDPNNGLEDENPNDQFIQVAISPDQSSVYLNWMGDTLLLDTSSGNISFGVQIDSNNRDYEMSLSPDGTVLATAGFLTDSSLNESAAVSYVDRDTWFVQDLYNQQLNQDGSLLFQPLTGNTTGFNPSGINVSGIDVTNGSSGILQNRITFAPPIANVYDALVMDTADNFLFIITATGIARLDLNSLPAASIEAKRLRRLMRANGGLPGVARRTPSQKKSQKPHYTLASRRPDVNRRPRIIEPQTTKRDQNQDHRQEKSLTPPNSRPPIP
ncbi:MAG TPA: choice-of-anchor D domain-containing protein [Terriglobales bacterium]